MDELLVALRNSGVGCHIGNTFCGSFGYADDVIIVCPTIHSIRKMLSICEEFAYQFDVSFNSDKSKLLVFTKRRCISHNNPPLRLQFMNGYIMESRNEKHLGNIIGHQCKQSVIDSGVNELYIKVNQLLSLFSNASPQVRYKLFQTHCMSLYGSQLWDYEHKITNTFFIAWRKSVRRVLGLPATTHCKYIHGIADDHDINHQLYIRSVKFIRSLHSSPNVIS